MSGPENPTRSNLRKASELIHAGKKREARQILRTLLLSDQRNLEAWKLLAEISEHSDEKAFCQEQVLRLSAIQEGSSQPLSIREGLLPPEELPKKPEQKPPQKPVAKPPVIIPNIPLWGTEALPDQESPPVEEKRKRKRSLAPLWIGGIFLLGCLGLWGLALLSSGFLPVSMPVNLTATAIAETNAYCAALVQNALDASGNFCDQIGPNRVCYGNITLQAELQPDTTDRFSERGDVVAVDRLRRLAAAPLDLNTNEWGVAIFKVMANLPNSLPGQTVTMVVFGNTVLDNQSGNLEAFYFFSQLGRIVCEKALTEGLLITMPDGAGIKFMVNGTELTLMGNASLTATRNGEMEVSMHSGSGVILADGVEQTFSAGEKVSVPLGGPSGADAIGPPSAPEPLSDEEREEICTLTGEQCPQEGPGGTPSTAGPTLPGRTPTATRTATRTPTRTTTPSPSMTNTLFYKTLTASRTPTTAPTVANTFTQTPLPTRTPRPTRTLRPTSTPGGGGGPTNTPIYTATATRTSTATYTPTQTLTPTQTFTNIPAGGPCAPAVASAGALTNGPATELHMNITNNSVSDTSIDSIHIEWVEFPSQNVTQITLAGSVLFFASDPDEPSDLPSELPWAGGADLSLPAGTPKTLIIEYINNLQNGTYNVDVAFPAPLNCQVHGSLTLP